MNNTENDTEDVVAGERTIPTVNKAQSVQSMINNVLGIAMFAFVGIGFLYWYYSHAFTKQGQKELDRQKRLDQQTQGEGTLPRLAEIPFPTQATPEPRPTTEPANVGDIFAPPPLQQPASNAYGNQNQKTPEQLAEERRLSGAVFVKGNGTTPSAPQVSDTAGNNAQNGMGSLQTTGTNEDNRLGSLLKPTLTATTHAQVLPTLTYLIPKGAKGDCTLETAIDSQLPGMVTCVLAFDIFGADGNVVMLERGTTLNGETRSVVQQGQNRVFVLWSEARTPKGVVAQLASPATDSLGRSGVSGELDTHFWDRFGAAILVSVINGAVQAGSSYASGAGNNGGTSFNYNMQGANSVMTEVLKSTINIPPTISVRQGERVQILFARDVDFRPVYALGDKYQTTAYPE
jgi:type IV secretion system protein VirB10